MSWRDEVRHGASHSRRLWAFREIETERQRQRETEKERQSKTERDAER